MCLPDLLKHRRTHAATEPIPDGLVPCAHVYPPHPAKDALGEPRPFDPARHDAFQAMLRTFGDPDQIALKQRVLAAVAAGESPSVGIDAPTIASRGTNIRVALRQLRASRTDGAGAGGLDGGARAFAERRSHLMDGIHDMGGMHGFGKVEPEPNEPVFHAPWEGRALALNRVHGLRRPVDHRQDALRDRKVSAGVLSHRVLLQEMVRAAGEHAGRARPCRRATSWRPDTRCGRAAAARAR